jgi:erythronate-4-phosphate dehydrogenase
VISLHVPLTTDGEHPTFHLFDAGRLSRLEPGTILLNSARGAVIAGDALLKVLRDRPDLQVVLDVWEGEPQIDTRLLERVVIGTPHIAGYSMEAKLYATYRLREELCRYLRLPTAGVDKPNASSSLQLSVTRSGRGAENDRFCRSVLGQVLSLDSLTGQLRQSLAVSPGQEAAVFDRLRRQLAGRREFSAWRVTATGYTPAQLEFLKMVGFQISRH